jgi:hypothetical protein
MNALKSSTLWRQSLPFHSMPRDIAEIAVHWQANT